MWVQDHTSTLFPSWPESLHQLLVLGMRRGVSCWGPCVCVTPGVLWVLSHCTTVGGNLQADEWCAEDLARWHKTSFHVKSSPRHIKLAVQMRVLIWSERMQPKSLTMCMWNKHQQISREGDYRVQGKMRKHGSESRSRSLLKSRLLFVLNAQCSHKIRWLKSYFKTAKALHGWQCALQICIRLLGWPLGSPDLEARTASVQTPYWKPESPKTSQGFQLCTPYKEAPGLSEDLWGFTVTWWGARSWFLASSLTEGWPLVLVFCQERHGWQRARMSGHLDHIQWSQRVKEDQGWLSWFFLSQERL